MLSPDKKTPICTNTQLPKIEGIDTSVTTYILLPTTTDGVLKEVSGCPENEYLHVSSKNHDVCSNYEIDDYENLLRLQENTSTVKCHLLLMTQNKLWEFRKNFREICICQSKIFFHQVNNVCVL